MRPVIVTFGSGAVRRMGLFTALLCVVTGLLGCKADRVAKQGDWSTVPDVDPACTKHIFEGSRFTTCLYRPADEFRLVWRAADGQPLRSLAALEAALGADLSRVRFAMNAGMYDEEASPIGLFIQQGHERRSINLNAGPGNFHMKPNGVFAVDRSGRVSIVTSEHFSRRAERPYWATQSGPMLIIDGEIHPRFDHDGESRLVRNGVGVPGPEQAYFVISEDPVSFGRFARFFRDELGCRNALYLDGSVSSLWDPGASRRDGYRALGPMVLVLRR